jgi:hypothetical protein
MIKISGYMEVPDGKTAEIIAAIVEAVKSRDGILYTTIWEEFKSGVPGALFSTQENETRKLR